MSLTTNTYILHGPRESTSDGLVAHARFFRSDAYTWRGAAEDAISQEAITKPGTYFLSNGDAGSFVTIKGGGLVVA